MNAVASNPSPTGAGNALRATSDFYGGGPAIKLIRFGLSAVQILAPSLAVRAAYRLFGTPLPLKWRNRRFAPGSHWQRHAMAFEGVDLTTYAADGNPARSVLLIHGWGGHAAQMLPMADALIAQGMRPVLVEMPGHGHSRGTRSNLPQFARAIDYVTRRIQQAGGRVEAIIAHSLGANAAAFAVSRNLPADKLVLIAPPASPLQFTRLFANVFALSERTRAGMQQRIETTEAIVMPDLEPAAVGPAIRIPTLVVHDRGDRVNAFADGVAYSELIPGARLLATDGLGHRRVLADAQVIAAICQHLKGDRTAPEATAAEGWIAAQLATAIAGNS